MGDVVRLGPRPAQPLHDGSPEPLWRELLGRRLRSARLERGQRLVDTAGVAGISVQYLSEIERGCKEPSSEIIAAVAGALGLTLLDLTEGLIHDLRSARQGAPAGPGAPAGQDAPGAPSGPTVLALAV